MEHDIYSVNVTCNNCDQNGSVEIPKGQTVPSSMECPNCGCKTAKKVPTNICPPNRSIIPFHPKHPKPWITTEPSKDILPHQEDTPSPYTVRFSDVGINPPSLDMGVQNIKV